VLVGGDDAKAFEITERRGKWLMHKRRSEKRKEVGQCSSIEGQRLAALSI
jgi:hypothetical protein